MLTREDDIDAHALRRQGWTISAIARHLGRDRKTIRAYLAGRQAGVRAPAGPDRFAPFLDYCTARLTEDPHMWAATLFNEVTDLGYDRVSSTCTRQLRARGLRPACEPRTPTKGRPVVVIDHPPGEATQWDWVELPDPQASWAAAGYGACAFSLVGALAHPGRWRGVLCSSTDQPVLIDALHRVTTALGGLTRDWRFDRMATRSSASDAWRRSRGPDTSVEYGFDMHRRFLVKPGITGLWQISGRSDLSWDDSVRVDVRYVGNRSLTFDAMILWKTEGAVLRGSGAY